LSLIGDDTSLFLWFVGHFSTNPSLSVSLCLLACLVVGRYIKTTSSCSMGFVRNISVKKQVFYTCRCYFF